MKANAVVFSAKEAERFGHNYGEAASFWTPASDAIEELETRLPQYLGMYPPADDRPVVDVFAYGRQYYGVTRKGLKLVYLNAFNRPESFAPRWKTDIVDVQDGGSNYFQVYFDPATKEFIDLHYNGKA